MSQTRSWFSKQASLLVGVLVTVSTCYGILLYDRSWNSACAASSTATLWHVVSPGLLAHSIVTSLLVVLSLACAAPVVEMAVRIFSRHFPIDSRKCSQLGFAVLALAILSAVVQEAFYIKKLVDLTNLTSSGSGLPYLFWYIVLLRYLAPAGMICSSLSINFKGGQFQGAIASLLLFATAIFTQFSYSPGTLHLATVAAPGLVAVAFIILQHHLNQVERSIHRIDSAAFRPQMSDRAPR